MKIVKCNVLSVECHRALDAALTMRCPNNMQHDTSKVQRLPRKMTMELSKALRLPQKMQTHCLKTMQKYCPCHTKRLSTRLQTRENVRKYHAYHANRHYNLLGNLRKGELLQLPP